MYCRYDHIGGATISLAYLTKIGLEVSGGLLNTSYCRRLSKRRLSDGPSEVEASRRN
jgi:hypothetical protein